MHDDHRHTRGAGFDAPEQLSTLHAGCLAALGATGVAVAELSEPEDKKALGLMTKGFEAQMKADSQYSVASHGTEQEGADAKLFTTLRAHFALRGVSLHQLADGSFVASNWALTKPLADLQAVATFARQTSEVV